jgi:hypothetical protein
MRTTSTAFCYCCEGPAWPPQQVVTVDVRGRAVQVCPRCRTTYAYLIEQVSRFGNRFRFVRKSEIPAMNSFNSRTVTTTSASHAVFRRVFMFLLLAKELQENIRQKEVNWMADERAEKTIKLPGRIAKILSRTYMAQGDDASLEDDVALRQIADLLEDIDPNIMKNVQKKKRAS